MEDETQKPAGEQDEQAEQTGQTEQADKARLLGQSGSSSPGGAEVQAEEISEEEAEKLPFPTAAVVRLMKTKLDGDKMIKKEVKIAMNKWLGQMCESVATEMNKIPYTMMHLHEFNRARAMYDNLEEFQKEKERVLAHLEAIKSDIAKLERDLGKLEVSEMV